MSKIVEGLFYSPTHEWLKVEGKTALVGITDYAQSSLGDITFVQLPKPGASLSAGASFGVVESVKAASDLYAPADCTVLEVNTALDSAPETVNRDPYAEGWMLKVKLAGPVPAELLDADAYAKHVG